MNKLISLLLSLCLVLCLSVLGGSASVARASVTLYSQGDWVDPALLDAFTEETGIEVDYITSEDPLRQGEADVLLADSELLSALAGQGILAGLETDRLSSLGLIDEEYLLARGELEAYALPCLWTSMGLLYNPMRSDHQVTGWDNLFDTRFAGQIVMPERYREAFAVALAALGLDVNTEDESALERAAAALEQQQSMVVARCSPEELESYFVTGEATLAPCYASAASALMARCPHLSFVIPNEGSWRIELSYAVAADTQHPCYAYELIDYLCTRESLARSAVYCGYSTTSSAARALLDRSWRESPLAYPTLPEDAWFPMLEGMTAQRRVWCFERWSMNGAAK